MSKTITLLLIVFGLAFICLTGCRSHSGQVSNNPGESITIGVSSQPVSTAVYTAHAKGYFEKEGLHTKLESYTAGKEALNAVCSGKDQFATVAETPVMLAVLNGEKIYVIATIANVDKYMVVVARKDRGISSPSDLKGKRIGLIKGTTAEFFLHVYLTLNHIEDVDVNAVYLPPADIVNALLEGRVDAVCTWAPHSTLLKRKLGSNAVILIDPGAYTMNWNIAVTQKFAKSKPETIKKCLRAIIRATDYVNEHPDEARAIFANYTGMDSSLYDKEWENYRFTVILDQSLILNLEDQARWMRKEEGSTGEIPDFTKFIYTAGLKSIEPDAVRIPGE